MRSLVLLFSTISLLTLAACGDPDGGVLRKPIVIEDVPVANKVSYASAFPLFDIRSGSPRIPRTPAGKAPFGVLLGFVNTHQLEMCTINHWKDGQLLTNAHCVGSNPSPDAYYVVFYDKSGTHRYAAVQSFGYIGSTDADDVAVLNVDPKDVADWDALDATLESTADTVNMGLGVDTFETTVWSFDPLSSHPELGSLYHGSEGAVFYPKECTGFRTLPDIHLVAKNGDVLTYPATTVDVNKHILLDRCDRDPIQGNSGSWISAASDPSKGYGLFHWIITLRNQPIVQTLRTFQYTGSDGELLETAAGPNFSFYFVGTDLEYVLAQHPGVIVTP